MANLTEKQLFSPSKELPDKYFAEFKSFQNQFERTDCK